MEYSFCVEWTPKKTKSMLLKYCNSAVVLCWSPLTLITVFYVIMGIVETNFLGGAGLIYQEGLAIPNVLYIN